MSAIFLDSGAVSWFARRKHDADSTLRSLRRRGEWPLRVPSVVLVECLHGHPAKDAATHRFLASCEILTGLDAALAEQAAMLRRSARRGSAVDALVVAYAEPDGVVWTSDPDDLLALAAYAEGVTIHAI